MPLCVLLASLVVLTLLAIVFFTRQWESHRSLDGGLAQVNHLSMNGAAAASHLNATTTANTQGESSVAVPTTAAVQPGEETPVENSAETEMAHAGATNRSSARFGPLDSLDEMSLLAELPKGVNTRYWLERLAKLPAHEIPLNILPVIDRMANSPTDAALQSLAQQIINKSPFEEIDREQP